MYVCVCMCVCMHAFAGLCVTRRLWCIYICVCVCVCVCVCMYVCMHIYITCTYAQWRPLLQPRAEKPEWCSCKWYTMIVFWSFDIFNTIETRWHRASEWGMWFEPTLRALIVVTGLPYQPLRPWHYPVIHASVRALTRTHMQCGGQSAWISGGLP